MIHKANFTTIALTVFAAGIFSLFSLGTQSAAAFNCIPYDQITSTQLAPCGNLFKKETRKVFFPDATYTREPNGTGECATSRPYCCQGSAFVTECWPEFHQPVITAGRWYMLVKSKRASATIETCGPDCLLKIEVSCQFGNVNEFVVNHTCSSGGTGDGFGECLQTGETCSDYSECCSGTCSEGRCGDAQIGGSPVLIDVTGNGFDLTNALDGVNFDLNADGIREKLSWTAPGSDDAWLALDRNGNGKVDSGAELFGNFTAQPDVAEREKNGFLALGEFDKPANGGNNDGVITQADAVFASLRLWHDGNRNGTSEVTELRDLRTSGIEVLELDYKLSQRSDKYGNQFRFRAKLKDAQGLQLGRWAWDVFLLVNP